MGYEQIALGFVSDGQENGNKKIIKKVHCLFEQSGTFKKQFKGGFND